MIPPTTLSQIDAELRAADIRYRRRLRTAEFDLEAETKPLLRIRARLVTAEHETAADPDQLTLSEIAAMPGPKHRPHTRTIDAIRGQIKRALKKNPAMKIARGKKSTYARTWLVDNGIICPT